MTKKRVVQHDSKCGLADEGTEGNVSTGRLEVREMSNSTLQSVEHMRRRRTTWVSGAALLIALGTTGAVLGASAIARNSAQKSRQVFATSSAEVASTLEARHPA